MRKQNHSIRPALKRDSRLNNSVVPGHKCKRPNAQKHGAFAVSPVMPGEDLREFEELHSALIDEWQPCGPTEQDRVFGIADAMWRKLRSQKFLRAKLVGNTFNPRHPAFDERRGLATLGIQIRREPETDFEELARNHLRPDKIKHLNQKCPRANYQSASEWAKAVIEEIESVLLPAVPSLETPQPGEEADVLTQGMHIMISEMRLFVPIIHAGEFFEHDLDLRERLDARIARLVKELIQMKAMKQMLHQTSTGPKG